MSSPRARMSRRPLDTIVLTVLLTSICLASTWVIVEGLGAQRPRKGSEPSDAEEFGEGESGSLEAADDSLSFTITGETKGTISPGVVLPVDLSVENPHPQAISVKGLTVSVQELEAPNASVSLPCTVDDFAVKQFAGPAAFEVAASETISLSALDIAPVHWPKVGMHNTPVNQDGCKGASLKLLYTATGIAVTP